MCQTASSNPQFRGYLESKAGGPITGDLLRKVSGWSVDNISRAMGLGQEAHRAKQDVSLELEIASRFFDYSRRRSRGSSIEEALAGARISEEGAGFWESDQVSLAEGPRSGLAAEV